MGNESKSPFDNLWYIGVILATFASFISNLGLNLQKLLHLQNQGKSADIRDNYHRFGLWWLGLSLIVLGAIADFLALTFAPQSLVAPLGSLTLVSNIILSPIILKEVITSWDIFATLTIVLGCIISVAFASHADKVYPNDELFSFYLQWPFLVYAALVISFMVICFIAMKHYEAIERDRIRYTPLEESWHRLTYPAISGTIGAQSVLFAKCLVEMVVNAFDGRGLFLVRWQAYLIILAMAACIVFQIMWLNDGLLRFDAAFEVPVFQAFWVVLSVCSGLIFYNEYEGMTIEQNVLFGVGIVITVSGVIMLSRGRKVQRPGHDDSDDEDEANALDTRGEYEDDSSEDDLSVGEEGEDAQRLAGGNTSDMGAALAGGDRDGDAVVRERTATKGKGGE